MTAISPVCPVLHRFEYDPKRKRITGIRFVMDDGTEQVVGARVESVDMDADQLTEHEAGWLVDVRA